MTFADLTLPPALVTGLSDVGYVEMTPVQVATLPAILAGRDVIAEAHTGSGKTAAFALGALAAVRPEDSALQVLVLCPTRELADQTSREIRRLARAIPNLKVLTLCGGVPLRPQLASLTHVPQVVVGTPGRVRELLEKEALSCAAVKVLVLDEVDRLLDMGFADALDAIVATVPTRRQTLLFSATIPVAIRALSQRLQQAPLLVSLDDTAHAPAIEQIFCEVEPARKSQALGAWLLARQPASTVVFCNTRVTVRTVAADLAGAGFEALALHGELEQREREEVLVRFANRSATVLVASDVAARGLDIEHLELVVNYEIPHDADTYLHRIGRTGRAGRVGVALSLCAAAEVPRLRAIEERLGFSLRWLPIPATAGVPPAARFGTLIIDAGRQDKLRPGDLLGALTGTGGVPASAVGRIDVYPTRTYVAIARDALAAARTGLVRGKIKGRTFRVRDLALPR